MHSVVKGVGMVLCVAVLAVAVSAKHRVPAAKALLSPTHQRIVFLGDSITDGNTYPTLIRQALTEAGYAAPLCMCAGIGGDTLAGMKGRLETSVLALQPTLVTLSAGVNDHVPNEAFEADLLAVTERMKTARIPLLLLTPSIPGPRGADGGAKVAGYAAVMHKVAAQYGLAVAEVNQLMQQGKAAGDNLIEEDQVHPNFAGQRVIARAVLDALGYKDVPVPQVAKTALFAGVVQDWQMRVSPDKQPLDDQRVLAVKPDHTWTALHLPEATVQTAPWLEIERQNGFALSLPQLIGKGASYQGVAVLKARKARTVFVNVGAQVNAVWLNGTSIYNRIEPPWTGYHAGRARVQTALQKGNNTIIIETSEQFFLSVTDNNDW